MTDVLITAPAEYDLVNVEYAIFVDLQNPQAAERIVDGILQTIEDLRLFPLEHPPVNDSLLASLGIRMTWFENFNIFYYYEEERDLIHIIRILYKGADWQKRLAQFIE